MTTLAGPRGGLVEEVSLYYMDLFSVCVNLCVRVGYLCVMVYTCEEGESVNISFVVYIIVLQRASESVKVCRGVRWMFM